MTSIAQSSFTFFLSWRLEDCQQEDLFLTNLHGTAYWNRIGKIAAVEAGMLLSSTVALVEIVAYGIFFLLSFPLPKSGNYTACAHKRLKSSLLAGAGAFMFLFLNLFPTAEARINAFLPNGTIEENHQERLRVQQGNLTQERKKGAEALVKLVLSCQDKTIQSAFCECDPDIYTFILSKLIYLYVMGENKAEPIPLFFNTETQTLIAGLRDEWKKEKNSEQIKDEVKATLSSLNAFQEKSLQWVSKLQIAASAELQGSLLLTTSWKDAKDVLLRRE